MNTPQMTPDENSEEIQKREEIKQEVLHDLKVAASSEARVRTFGKLLDTYGVDGIFGLVVPEIGDAGASGLAGLYLLWEAQKAGLSKVSYLKIIGLQSIDFAIGVVPVAGDAVDFLWKANKWSTHSFEKKTDELVEKAREAGIPESDIAKITLPAEKVTRLVSRAIALSKPMGEHLKDQKV